jgi:transposase
MEPTVGIDIAKVSFSACVLGEEINEVRDFRNDGSGFRKLQVWLKKLKIASARVCLESTNRYWERLAQFLLDKHHRVSVVNPYRTSSYWKSEHLRAKTDHIDAGMIARFCNAQDPPLWQPPAAEFMELRTLVRELEFLKAERTRFRVRCEHGDGYSLKRVRTNLSKEINRLQRHIMSLVARHRSLQTGYKNLLSIPGIGKATALVMLSEIADKVQILDRDELVSYAGLAPRIFESGTSIRKSKGTCNPGNHRLKRAFYLPAVAAVRVSVPWKERFNRLVERGKPKKVALGAIMRKLFIVCCGVLKTDTAYDASFDLGLT